MEKHIMIKHLLITLMILRALTSSAFADTVDDVEYIELLWAEINYLLEGDEKETAFELLVAESEIFIESNKESAELLIWSAIVKSSYAGAKGGLGAVGLAKAAKAEFEAAMKIDADALDSSAYTSLGILYHSVPGWPIGFGDSKKAEALLRKGVENNPTGIDNNFFYANFLADEKDYEKAEEYYLRAQAAPPRPGRDMADKGRRAEIDLALKAVRAAQ
jgi:tetratricopeptide (TPR) repeat protein